MLIALSAGCLMRSKKNKLYYNANFARCIVKNKINCILFYITDFSHVRTSKCL